MIAKRKSVQRAYWLGTAIMSGLFSITVAITAATATERKHHWDYSPQNGPAKWSALNPEFALCGAGDVQSPVDIPTNAPIIETQISTYYDARAGSTVVNNGHTIQVNVPAGNRLKVKGKTYDLLQFHFHTPSENKIGGQRYPMEMHLVHKSRDGALAVIAVMLRSGGKGGLIDRLPTPNKAGKAVAINELHVNPAHLLPGKKSHFAFVGSLTTPPCSEGVTWVVMSTPVHVSQKTLKRFHGILGNNNRPVNPLNGRRITYTH